MIFYKHFYELYFVYFFRNRTNVKWKNLQLLKLWNKDKLNSFNRIYSPKKNDKMINVNGLFEKVKDRYRTINLLWELSSHAKHFSFTAYVNTWVPNALLSLKAHVFINKCIHLRLPALFLIPTFFLVYFGTPFARLKPLPFTIVANTKRHSLVAMAP